MLNILFIICNAWIVGYSNEMVRGMLIDFDCGCSIFLLMGVRPIQFLCTFCEGNLTSYYYNQF